MACKDIEERLPAYVEGVLSSDDTRVIREHLAQCPDCSMALADLQKTGELVRNLDAVEPPTWLTQKIMARVREEETEKRGLFHRLFFPLSVKIPIQVFASLCMVVIVLYLYRGMEPDIKVPQAPTGTVQVVPPAGRLTEPDKILKQAPPPVPGFRGAESAGQEKKVSVPPVQKEKETTLRDQSAEKPMEISAPRYEESKKARVPESAQEMGSAQKAPAPVVALPAAPTGSATLSKPTAPSPQSLTLRAKEKDGLEAARSVAKTEGKGKALIADRTLKSAYAEKGAPVTMTLTLVAKDVPAAATEVEKLLTELGARGITRLSRDDTIAVSARLAGPDMKDLVKKLKALGELEEKTPLPALHRGDTELSITIKR